MSAPSIARVASASNRVKPNRIKDASGTTLIEKVDQCSYSIILEGDTEYRYLRVLRTKVDMDITIPPFCLIEGIVLGPNGLGCVSWI